MVNNDKAEEYIKKVKSIKVPYNVNIRGIEITIEDNNVYPPGKLTEMFLDYLIEEDIIKGKYIADLGCGCFALGVIAALHGAQKVVGIDVNKKAIDCAKKLIKKQNLKNTLVLQSGVNSFLKSFSGYFDIMISGAPWDSTQLKFDNDALERAFYDVNDELLTSILSNSRVLFKDKNKGQTFITSSQRALGRVEKLCLQNQMQFEIVKSAELELGNPHYILKLFK